MNKLTWICQVFLPLALAWSADQILKFLCSHAVDVSRFGPLGISLKNNSGLMGGFFSSLPALLRIVPFSTAGVFLLFVFFVIQFFSPVRSVSLRIGLSLLMGGIMGNVTDRILRGYVTDFAFLEIQGHRSVVFNFADVIQWVGLLALLWGLFKDRKHLWPDRDLRGTYWVNTQFQWSYCLKLVGCGLAFGLILATCTYTFLRVIVNDLGGLQSAQLANRYFLPFVITFLFVTLIFLIVLFFVGLLFSHRIAGPLYAFEKFLEDFKAGKPRPLKLRAGDEFKHLEALAADLAENYTLDPK
jgi:signal peptidase II